MPLKKFLCFSAALCGSFSAQAEEPATLKADFRRVGLELSSTNVTHSREYQNSPVTQLSTDGQTVVKGVFDFLLEYNRDKRRNKSQTRRRTRGNERNSGQNRIFFGLRA